MTSESRAALVWLYAVLATLLMASLMVLAGGQTSASFEMGDALIVAVAMAVVHAFPVHLETATGRQTLVMSEAVLVVGLFTVAPASLVVGGLVGILAAVIRQRLTLINFVASVSHAGVWLALPTWAFHVLVGMPDPRFVPDVSLALGLGGAAWIGRALMMRIPRGLSTGAWAMASTEVQDLTVVALTAIGAASLALLGASLADDNALLLGLLLLLPVISLALSMTRHRVAAESQRAVMATLHLADLLRNSDDPARLIAQEFATVAKSFDADAAYLLLAAPGATHRVSYVDGESKAVASLPSEAALRSWVKLTGGINPSTDGTATGIDLHDALNAKELLLVPIVVGSEPGILAMVGRRLGPFRSEHVQLARTLSVTAVASVERHHLALQLSAAGLREEAWRRRASRDPLTSLANRETFEMALQEAIDGEKPSTVLFLDLNDFKAINDNLGHAAGDAVLCSVADRLRSELRVQDVAARLGGDEFALLIRDGIEIGALLGDRIDRALSRWIGEVDIPGVRAAIGMTEVQDLDTVAEVLARADAAMYLMKRGGPDDAQMDAPMTGLSA